MFIKLIVFSFSSNWQTVFNFHCVLNKVTDG